MSFDLNISPPSRIYPPGFLVSDSRKSTPSPFALLHEPSTKFSFISPLLKSSSRESSQESIPESAPESVPGSAPESLPESLSEFPESIPNPASFTSPYTKRTYRIVSEIDNGTYATVYKAEALIIKQRLGQVVEEKREYALKMSRPETILVKKDQDETLATNRLVENDSEKLTDETYEHVLEEETLELAANQRKEETLIHALNSRSGLPIIECLEGFNFKQQRITVYPLLAKNLHQANEEGDFRSLQKIREIAHQILTGLDHLATCLIIHQDLKPENILLEEEGSTRVQIADFGLAATTTAEQTRTVQTPYYRAPEVALGLPYDEKIDIWSAGCIFAELYTKTPLIEESSPKSLKIENQRVLNKIANVIGPIPLDLLKQSGQPFHMRRIFPQRTLAQILFNNKSLQTLNNKERQFLDLLQKMLKINPKERISAQEALRHPFFMDVSYAARPLQKDTTESKEESQVSFGRLTKAALLHHNHSPLLSNTKQSKALPFNQLT